MRPPNLNEEKKMWKKGYKRVVCLDESGRGPLAGPVVAAAVMIKNPKLQAPNYKQIPITKIQNSKQKSFDYLRIGILNLFGICNLGFGISKLRDSKKLSPKKREKFYKLIDNIAEDLTRIGFRGKLRQKYDEVERNLKHMEQILYDIRLKR